MKKNEALFERCKVRIASGAIKAGERLPSVREEAAASGVSVNTVVYAYERLVDEGWARTRERSGYYARSRTTIAAGRPAPLPEHFVSTAREAGERLDLIFERLVREDSSFAIASPGTDLLPVDRLEASLGQLKHSWVEYAEPAGDAALRKRIALASEDTDGPTKPDDIVVTNGATEAMSLVLQALLKPGDTVILESPTYYNYFRQLAPLEVKIVEVPVGPDHMDLDILERELDARAVRMVIVQPNVQNPTGVTMSDAAKARLVAMTAGRGVSLIQDDVYGDLVFGLQRPKNLSAFGDHPGLALVSSFSKSVGPGLRVGWIRAPALASRLAEIKLRTSMETCRLAQGGLADFVATKDHRRHLSALRAALEKRIDEHIDLLAGILPEGSSVRRPSGGCLLWIRLPEGTDATSVFERSAGKGFIAAPGELFSSNPFFRNYIRINAGWKLDAKRAKALACLGDLG
jgi:DNA-binding transcriptional MocR family regulator